MDRAGPVQRSTPPNANGLPDGLASGVERLSGVAMDDVRVHYNSQRPALLAAHAYSQGNEIHLGPGQERHLPHEAWHVVQQKQGRVRPTTQIGGTLPLNDDATLEHEAEVMGNRAARGFGAGRRVGTGSEEMPEAATVGPRVVQRNGVTYLRLGIISYNSDVPFYANELPHDMNVWILSNEPVGASDLDTAGVTSGMEKSSPLQIVAANDANVKNRKRMDEARSGGKVTSRIFQSGPFQVPRQDRPKNRNEVDYSFLRYAAFESYKRWHASTGNALGWPSLTDPGTLVETIDSDVGGIKGSETDDVTQLMQTDWLAESGVYSWDWKEIQDLDTVKKLFTTKDKLDAGARDQALKEFSTRYDQAEISARQAQSGDMFKIYFPEPATRLSASALTLLSMSGFGNLKVTRGTQVGYKRESIGLVAGLVHLDKKTTKNLSRSKSKLRFNAAHKVTTGLGKRKGAYASVFRSWYAKAAKDDGGFDQVDLSKLDAAKQFDQSYLNPGVPKQVSDWHNNTLAAMDKDDKNAAKYFFHPKS